MRLLLIDDQQPDRELVKIYLLDEMPHVTVGEAASLREAMETLKGQTYDGIVLDLSLPDTDRLSGVEEMVFSHPQVPLLILTGHDDERLAVEALKVGAEDYLVKGRFDEKTLAQRLRYAIERHRASEAQFSQQIALIRDVVSGARSGELQSDPQNIFFRCVEDIEEGLALLDRAGRVAYFNPAWAKIFRIELETSLGKPFLLFGESVAGLPRLHEIEKTWRGVISWIPSRFSGEERLIDLTVTPKSRGYVIIASDVTLRKQLESQAYETEKLMAMGVLASGLAHEIGTPLGIVRGHAELLRQEMMTALKKAGVSDVAPSAGVDGSIGAMIRQIDHVSRLVESMQRLSRERGRLEVKSTALAPLVEETLLLLKTKFDHLGISFQTEVDGTLRALADGPRLQQVLINLIINALQAIEEAVRRGRTGPHTLQVKGWREEKQGPRPIHLMVRDSGVGMDEDVKRKVFQPFFTTKDVGKGTGLGLSITYALLKQMDAEITVESHKGVGTTFQIALREV